MKINIYINKKRETTVLQMPFFCTYLYWKTFSNLSKALCGTGDVVVHTAYNAFQQLYCTNMSRQVCASASTTMLYSNMKALHFS